MIRNLFVCIIELTFLVYLGIESFEPRNTITKKELFVTYDETDYIAGATYKNKLIDYVAFYSTIFVGDICVEIFSIYTEPLKSDKCKYRSPYIVNKCDLVKGGTIERHYGFFRYDYLFFNNLGVLKDRKVGGINYTVFARVCNEGGINRYATRLIVLKPFKLKCVNVQVLDPNLFDSKVAINVSWSKKYIHQVFRFDILLFRDNSCIFYMEINVNNKMEIALNKPLPNIDMTCSIKLHSSRNVDPGYFNLLIRNEALIPLENLTIRVIPINGFGKGSYKDLQVKVGKYFSGPAVNVTVNVDNASVSWHDPVHLGGIFGGYYFYVQIVKQNLSRKCICLKKINFTIGNKSKLDCEKVTNKTLVEHYELVVVTEEDMTNSEIHLLDNDMFFIAPFNDYGVSNATQHFFIKKADPKYDSAATKIDQAESKLYFVFLIMLIPGILFVYVSRDNIFNFFEKIFNNNSKTERKSEKFSTGSEISEI